MQAVFCIVRGWKFPAINRVFFYLLFNAAWGFRITHFFASLRGEVGLRRYDTLFRGYGKFEG